MSSSKIGKVSSNKIGKVSSNWVGIVSSVSRVRLLAKTIAGTQRCHTFIPLSLNKIKVKEYSNSDSSMIVSAVRSLAPELSLGEIQGYVAVVEYDENWWVAYGEELHPDTHEVSLNFLHPHGLSPSLCFHSLKTTWLSTSVMF